MFDSQIHGSSYQLFGSAEEVLGSSEWLEDMVLYTNPAGIRMACGCNMEKPDRPELRCYVEGKNTVFLISMIVNPSYHDIDECRTVMREVADKIIPGANSKQTAEQRIARFRGKTPEQIVAEMTPRQKACQMVQPASYNVSSIAMSSNCCGSLLSQQSANSMDAWVALTDHFQKEALLSSAGIPYIYGNDDVHGVNYCLGAVIFPHNIGIGAPSNQIQDVTTVLEGLRDLAADHDIRIITDPAEAASADVVILCVGEKPYAEWLGDSPDPSLDGIHALYDNRDAIEEARALGKPTVTLIIAGRHVFLSGNDLDSWDSTVMCYLPGSEGIGIAKVLFGEVPFSGRLPSPWYRNSDEIRTDSCRWPYGYGLSYASEVSE